MGNGRKAGGVSFGLASASYVATIGNNPGNSAYTDAVMQDSPLAFYMFDEASGTVMTDSSGNAHHGSYINTPTLGIYNIIANDGGNSAYFDGNNNGEKATVTYGAWMDTTSMTIMTTCIVQPAGLSMIASRYTDVGNDWSWFLYTNSNKFMLYYRSSGGTNYNIDSGVLVSGGVRYFVSAYVGASEAGIRVYDDTGLIASATGPGATLNPSSKNLILMDCDPPNPYPMIGYLDGLAYLGSALTTTRQDQLAGYAMGSTSKWVNRAAGVSPRNGTTDHTITFPAASAGSLLVAIISSPEANSMVTAGWTKRISCHYDTELAVYTRSANVGDSSFQVTLPSESNFPLHYIVYEFPTGSAWHSSTNNQNSAIFPDITGLPGTPVTVFAIMSMRRTSADTPGATLDWRFFWKSDFNQETVYNGVTNGIFTGVGYLSDLHNTTASTYYPEDEFIEFNTENSQRALFALTIP